MATICFVFVALLLTTAINASVTSNVAPETRIIGGTTAEIKNFPFMALILWTNVRKGYLGYFTGTLVSEKFVLTVAHDLLG